MYHTIREFTPDQADIPSAFAAELSEMDRGDLLAIASNVNARLLHHGMSNATLHEQLERDLLTDDLRDRLAAARQDRTADQTVVFTRAALLLMSKIALGLRQTASPRHVEDHEFGRLVLMLNELIQGQQRGSDDDLMLSSMASWSMYVPLRIDQLIARYRRIVRRLQTSDHPAVIRARELLHLEPLLFDGLPHEEFQSVLFATYALLNKAISEGKPPVLTIEPPLPAFTDEARVRALFSRRGQRFEEFTDWRYGTWAPERLAALLTDRFFIHDHTSFLKHPLVILEDGFLLPDFQLALERFTFGTYWTIFDSFDDADDRKLFSGAWGHAFEEYVLGLMADTYPTTSGLASIFRANVPLSPREIDAVIDFDDHTIVIEVKSTLLPVDIRSSRDLRVIDTWIQERLWGKKGGLQQLVGDALAIRDGHLGGTRGRVYPVLITDEPSFQAIGVNRHLGRSFAERVGDDTAIQPLTVVTTDELEELLSCIVDGLVTWRGVLDRRATDRDGWLWAGQALRNELRANGHLSDTRLHPTLKAEHQTFMDQLSMGAGRS